MSNNNTSESVPVAEKPKIGRPTIRSQELADSICDRIAIGESLRSICEEDAMPCIKSVMLWLNDDLVFLQQYRNARDLQSDYFLDEQIEIADGVEGETENAVVSAAKLRCDARRWAASKLNPKKYGDRPGDIHVTTAVNNFHVDSSRLNQLQERRSKQLERNQVRALPEKTV